MNKRKIIARVLAVLICAALMLPYLFQVLLRGK